MSENTEVEPTGYDETAAGLRLIIAGTGEEFPLGDDPVTVGSEPDNTVVLDDPDVSGHHATIRAEEEGYVIEDAGTEAGTYVNEQRIEGTMPLKEGDAIRTGNTILDYGTEAETEAGPEEAEAPAAMPPVAPPP